MQRRLVKTIHATQVTSVAATQQAVQLFGDEERQALRSIAERDQAELDLRRAGLTPLEIERLRFLKWSIQHRGDGSARPENH